MFSHQPLPLRWVCVLLGAIPRWLLKDRPSLVVLVGLDAGMLLVVTVAFLDLLW